MLLRIDETRVVNLNAYKEMRFTGPNDDGLYQVEWWRSGEGPLELPIAKDRAVAKKVFDGLALAWGENRGIFDWGKSQQALFRGVLLSWPWSHLEFSVKDAEPRFRIRNTQSAGQGSNPRLFDTDEMRRLLAAMRSGSSWPPDDDDLWRPAVNPHAPAGPSAHQLQELIRTLQATLGEPEEFDEQLHFRSNDPRDSF